MAREWTEADPEYYQAGNYDILDVIQDFNLNFALGNVFKYIVRAGKKGSEHRLSDLRKAAKYLEREIERELVFGEGDVETFAPAPEPTNGADVLKEKEEEEKRFAIDQQWWQDYFSKPRPATIPLAVSRSRDILP